MSALYIYNHLSKFLLEQNLIYISQFGFRKHDSTTQQLLLYLDRVHKSLNINAQCDVIYLDFRKAFDSVPHNELLLKLWNIGITGNTWHWIKEYLTGRLQCVNINSFLSPSLPVISGVPQGSILGPLLFLVYINDLPTQAVHSDLLLFADDAKCLKPILSPSDSQQLQCDLDNLFGWSVDWKLSFNNNKCSVLHIHASQSSSLLHNIYILDGQQVNSCSCQKTLALWCPMICHGQIILLTLPTKLTRSLVCSVGLFATTKHKY